MLFSFQKHTSKLLSDRLRLAGRGDYDIVGLPAVVPSYCKHLYHLPRRCTANVRSKGPTMSERKTVPLVEGAPLLFELDANPLGSSAEQAAKLFLQGDIWRFIEVHACARTAVSGLRITAGPISLPERSMMLDCPAENKIAMSLFGRGLKYDLGLLETEDMTSGCSRRQISRRLSTPETFRRKNLSSSYLEIVYSMLESVFGCVKAVYGAICTIGVFALPQRINLNRKRHLESFTAAEAMKGDTNEIDSLAIPAINFSHFLGPFIGELGARPNNILFVQQRMR